MTKTNIQEDTNPNALPFIFPQLTCLFYKVSSCDIIMGFTYPISQCVPLYTSLSWLTTAATNGITQNAQYGPKN